MISNFSPQDQFSPQDHVSALLLLFYLIPIFKDVLSVGLSPFNGLLDDNLVDSTFSPDAALFDPNSCSDLFDLI